MVTYMRILLHRPPHPHPSLLGEIHELALVRGPAAHARAALDLAVAGALRTLARTSALLPSLSPPVLRLVE